MTKAIRTPDHLEFPCQTFKQGKQELILFPCSGKTLWEIVVVNQFNEQDKLEGYQRVLSLARAQKIAEFIDEGNLIPNSVLISFDEGTIKSTSKGPMLKVANKPNAGWVIDGQHRLAGASQSEEDIILPVVATIGLSPEQQAHCFVTINKEHKGVPSSLFYELMRKLPGAKTETQKSQERATDLARLLRLDDESPFFGKIVSSLAPKKGELSMTNFVRKVAPLLKSPSGRLAIFNDEQRCSAINFYYRALAQVFDDEYEKENSIFFRTLGFGALMNVLPYVMDLAINEKKKFRVQDAVAIFRKIDGFDFSKWHRLGTGNDAENKAAEDLQSALSAAWDSNRPGNSIFD